MLIHHFGSKDGLWVAIVQEVEQRQREVLADVPLGEGGPAELMRSWWRHISDESLWANERLFFEIYGRGLHGRAPSSDLLDGVVESWVEPAAGQIAALGVDPQRARVFARLGLAVTRGLLLDLLATEDRTGVDEAMEQWIELSVSALLGGDRAS